jgi:Ca2+-binding RTX toxin-like protein
MIETGAGDDTIKGGDGNDLIYAGAGDDTIDVKDGVRDTVYCGPGQDTVTLDKQDVARDCEVTKH